MNFVVPADFPESLFEQKKALGTFQEQAVRSDIVSVSAARRSLAELLAQAILFENPSGECLSDHGVEQYNDA